MNIWGIVISIGVLAVFLFIAITGRGGNGGSNTPKSEK